jgi:hypothetical protein
MTVETNKKFYFFKRWEKLTYANFVSNGKVLKYVAPYFNLTVDSSDSENEESGE